jgi:hypothetical protein
VNKSNAYANFAAFSSAMLQAVHFLACPGKSILRLAAHTGINKSHQMDVAWNEAAAGKVKI